MFLLIIGYCLNQKRRIFLTLLILFQLYSACIYLESNFIFIMIILLIFIPIFLNKSEDNKLNCTIPSIFFPLILTILIQIYGFKNIIIKLINLNKRFRDYVDFDIFTFIQNIVHGEYINELNIIAYIFNYLKEII